MSAYSDKETSRDFLCGLILRWRYANLGAQGGSSMERRLAAILATDVVGYT